MPFIFKTLERLSKWHLEQHATSLHKDQHAFRKDHCTENALSHMTDSVERGLKEKKVVLAVFLDIKGAFDNLNTNIITHGMRKHDVDDDIIEWLNGYLDNRYCQVRGSSQFELGRQAGPGQQPGIRLYRPVPAEEQNKSWGHRLTAKAITYQGRHINNK
jgi:hypothetical protein